ncbi:MAG TPA: hypothetical protein VFJ12_01545 [Segeticoccus sp.]|jgi:hypothetical protein|nr:hypothetical protein [Segeticoccus sp.]
MAAAIPWQGALTYWAFQGQLLVREDTSIRAVAHRRQLNDISTGILTVVILGVGLVAAVAADAAAALLVLLLAAPVLIDLPVRLPVVTKLKWQPNLAWHGDDPVWVNDDEREGAFVYALILSPGAPKDRQHLLEELSQTRGLPVMVASLNRD